MPGPPLRGREPSPRRLIEPRRGLTESFKMTAPAATARAVVLGATQTGVVDKFEPPSEVSNFDRTATIQGAQMPRC